APDAAQSGPLSRYRLDPSSGELSLDRGSLAPSPEPGEEEPGGPGGGGSLGHPGDARDRPVLEGERALGLGVLRLEPGAVPLSPGLVRELRDERAGIAVSAERRAGAERDRRTGVGRADPARNPRGPPAR